MPNNAAFSHRRTRRAPCCRAEVLEPRTLLAIASGVVFNDVDGDGAIDAGEPGLAGWTVYQDQNNNGVVDGQDRSTATDASGSYTLTLFPILFGPQQAHLRVVPANSQWVVTGP